MCNPRLSKTFIAVALVTAAASCTETQSAARGKGDADASLRDASVRDASVRDASVPDASILDASIPDASVTALCQVPRSHPRPVPPSDGRCDLTPRQLVKSSDLPVPTDVGPVNFGIGQIVATPTALYYSVLVSEVSLGHGPIKHFPGSMMRVPLRGGESVQVSSDYVLYNAPLLTKTALIVHGLAVSEHADTIEGTDAILSFPLSGGPPTTILNLPQGDGFGDGFATDGRFLYYSDSYGLVALPLTGDAGLSDVVTMVEGADTEGMGVFGKELVFLVPQGPDEPVTAVAKVQSVPLPPRSHAEVTMRGTGGESPQGFTACGSYACWADDGTHSIYSFAPSTGKIRTVVPLAGPFAEAAALVFDGIDFYILGYGESGPNQNIVRVSADGSCAAVIVTMPGSNDYALAVDDECIYWVNDDGIFSLAKSVYAPVHL